jgi:hypothetical protein
VLSRSHGVEGKARLWTGRRIVVVALNGWVSNTKELRWVSKISTMWAKSKKQLAEAIDLVDKAVDFAGLGIGQ